MRTFGADEIIISTHPEGRSNWLERGVVESARERFTVPITHVVIDLDREREEIRSDCGYSSSWVQRNRAIVLRLVLTVASQTCVVRPPWTSRDSHSILPSRAVPRKFVFSSIVVKLGRAVGQATAMQP